MRVIPFNPGGRGGTGGGAAERPEDAGAPDAAMAGGGDAGGSAGEGARIRRLEHALIDVLRENAANWARAERAERLLAEQAPKPPDEGG